MRLHRFYISPTSLSQIVYGQTLSFESKIFDSLIHQWKDVFRYKVGDKIHVFNELVGEWLLEFKSLDKKTGAVLSVIEQYKVPQLSLPRREIALYMSVIKNSNFDLVVEKVTELGVTKIVPISTERTIKTGINFERLNRLATEATEQSGRISPPQIQQILSLEKAIEDAKIHVGLKSDEGYLFFGHISDSDTTIARKDILSDSNKSMGIFIGPEGGWSDEEISLFKKEGIQPVCLGQFVLRAETAAIVAISFCSR